jgi:hypothetical protein
MRINNKRNKKKLKIMLLSQKDKPETKKTLRKLTNKGKMS